MEKTAAAPSLSVQLRHAAQCVHAVQQGRSLSEVLPQVDAALRPGVQALVFHALRCWGTAQAVMEQLVQRKPSAEVAALLACALALLLDKNAAPASADDGTTPSPALRTDAPCYAAHTVVNQAVKAASEQRSTAHQAAFINACLRRFLRQREALLAAVAQWPPARWNHPLWWIERVQRDHPLHWAHVLAASGQPGPMTLRVNRRRTSRTDYEHALSQAGMQASPSGADGLVLHAPAPVDRLPGFSQGQVSVQDAGAQLAASLLLAGRTWTRADRVLDACAAPGGKTAHLLELAELDLLALDISAPRCSLVEASLHRLGLQAQVRCADAAQPSSWWDGRAFDAILLDAPCTASGIVRRHPDVCWLRRPTDVAQLAATQRALLQALWPLLKPGGRLLYCTCSVFHAEGQEQIDAFIKQHPDAVSDPGMGHLLPGVATDHGPDGHVLTGDHDGFFYARLHKR